MDIHWFMNWIDHMGFWGMFGLACLVYAVGYSLMSLASSKPVKAKRKPKNEEIEQ